MVFGDMFKTNREKVMGGRKGLHKEMHNFYS
jgi:hypothetical protein